MFVLCIALGVAAVAAIGSLAAAFEHASGARGPAAARRRSRASADPPAGDGRRARPRSRRSARSASPLAFRAMARARDGTARSLVEVKAVDAAYPLYGESSSAEAGRRWRRPGASQGVGRSPSARCSTGSAVDVGDRSRSAIATVEIARRAGEEPDRLADRARARPELIISRETLAETGLVQPGSLIDWRYRVKLPEARAAIATRWPNPARVRAEAPRGRLPITRPDGPRAGASPRSRPLDAVPEFCRADFAAARRHRRRQRHQRFMAKKREVIAV